MCLFSSLFCFALISLVLGAPQVAAPASTIAVSSPNSECTWRNSSDCTVYTPWFTSIVWRQGDTTTTITAATVIYVLNEQTNATRTITQTNQLPDGWHTPEYNADGTRIQTVTLEGPNGESSESVLAYPTAVSDYQGSYRWKGALPTAVNNVSTCSSVSEEFGSDFVTLPSHPPLPGPTEAPDVPPDGDQYGSAFMAVTLHLNGDMSFYKSAFPDVGAIQSCTPIEFAAMGPLITALYLTETSYIKESDLTALANQVHTNPGDAQRGHIEATDTETGLMGAFSAHIEDEGSTMDIPEAAAPTPQPAGIGNAIGNVLGNGIGKAPVQAPELLPKPAPVPNAGLPAQTNAAVSNPAPPVQAAQPAQQAAQPVQQASPPQSIVVAGQTLALTRTAIPVQQGGVQTFVPAVVVNGQTATEGQVATVNGIPLTISALSPPSSGGGRVVAAGNGGTPGSGAAAVANLNIAGNGAASGAGSGAANGAANSNFASNANGTPLEAPIVVMADGQRVTLAAPTSPSASGSPALPITISGQTLLPVALPNAPGGAGGTGGVGAFVIGSQTLSLGSTITLAGGQVASYSTNAAGESVVAVGGKTTTLKPAAAAAAATTGTGKGSIGAHVMSGLQTGSDSAAEPQDTGAAGGNGGGGGSGGKSSTKTSGALRLTDDIKVLSVCVAGVLSFVGLVAGL